MDYFNQKERQKQKQFAQQRDKILRYIIKKMVEWRISKNMASAIGVLFLISACITSPNYYLLVALFLALYLFFDAIDGGIARYTNSADENGSVIDIICDQMGVVFLSAAYMYYYETNYLSVFIFSQSYISFIILVVYINQKNIRTIPFVRVKYVFYILYTITPIIGNKIINGFVVLFSIYYILMFLGFMLYLNSNQYSKN